MVADRTNFIKVILWEDTIDKVSAGKSYLLQNVTIRSFYDTKFVRNHSCTRGRRNYRWQYKYTRSSGEPPHRTVRRDRQKEKYVMPCLQSLPFRRRC